MNKSILSKRTVVVMRSLTRVLNLDEEALYSFDVESRHNVNDEVDSVREAVEKNCDPANVIQVKREFLTIP